MIVPDPNVINFCCSPLCVTMIPVESKYCDFHNPECDSNEFMALDRRVADLERILRDHSIRKSEK